MDHTPGPWIFENDTSYRKRGQIVVRDTNGAIDSVAWIRSGRKSSEANARLIAAAPDLLTALVFLRNNARGLAYSDVEWVVSDAISDADLAIAKATKGAGK